MDRFPLPLGFVLWSILIKAGTSPSVCCSNLIWLTFFSFVESTQSASTFAAGWNLLKSLIVWVGDLRLIFGAVEDLLLSA